jgi:hypothetical protein
MAVLTHRCTKCGHPDFWRGSSIDGRSAACSCGCTCSPAEQPVTAPTFDLAGRPIDRLVKPGEKFGAEVMTNVTSCGCPACKAEYERLGGTAPQATEGDEPPGTAPPSPRMVRAWAAEHSIPCPPRGRIPADVMHRYTAAHE